MVFLTFVFYAAFAVVVQSDEIDIDWSIVKPISQLPEYKAALENQAKVKFNLNYRKIVGGKQASTSQFPYQAGLLMNVYGSLFACGGSLISKNRVLTAAHCAEEASEALVILGANYLDRDEPGQVKMTVPVSGLVCHSEYDPDSLQNDVAMIKLPSPVVFNNIIRPIALPERSNDLVGVTAVASGWGNFDQTQKPSPFLRFVNLKVITNSKCNEEFPDSIFDTTICAMGEGDVGTCHGDSGGPLAVDINGKRILVGVTSFGIDNRCGPGIPVGFSRITSFLSWIKSNM
ncbi:unnamed protein product [Diamesa hyperborea]